MTHTVQFLLRHGYSVLFLAVLAEQLGLPFPAAPVLLAAGALAGTGALSFGAALALAMLASLIGDLLWFQLGARKGSSVLALLCRISLEPDSCVRRTKGLYSRYGFRSLLLAKFVPGLSTVAPPLAGVFRLKLHRFLLLDGAGAALWSGVYLTAGYLFRTELERLAGYAASMGTSLGIALGGAVALYLALKYLERRRFYRQLRSDRITPAELAKLLEDGAPPLIVDLRHPAEWDQGKVPGALLLRDDEEPDFAPGREVVFYCS